MSFNVNSELDVYTSVFKWLMCFHFYFMFTQIDILVTLKEIPEEIISLM